MIPRWTKRFQLSTANHIPHLLVCWLFFFWFQTKNYTKLGQNQILSLSFDLLSFVEVGILNSPCYPSSHCCNFDSKYLIAILRLSFFMLNRKKFSWSLQLNVGSAFHDMICFENNSELQSRSPNTHFICLRMSVNWFSKLWVANGSFLLTTYLIWFSCRATSSKSISSISSATENHKESS